MMNRFRQVCYKSIVGNRTMKRKLKRFWREWGVTFEEFEMFVCAIGFFVLPLLLRILFFVI